LTEERQRQRIAAALHDSICQSLAFAKRELGALEPKAPKAMRESLEQVSEQVGQAINQVRDLTLELAPSVLYTLGLEAAIEDLADQFSGADGFVCEVRISDEPKPLSEEVKSLLYRAVRELLVNVSKHAQAQNVSIDIGRDESSIRITVEDDGIGFSSAEDKGAGAQTGGFGLFSIRQRLTHVGGKLTIESGQGKGTTVMLIAPLDLG
jgi:signal transduction histidine kinase